MRVRPVVLCLLCASVAPCATDVTAMRRLTHSQYNHTVHDLLGDQTNPANQFPQEDFVNGFKNQTSAQSVPPLLAEAYGAAAEKLARNAFRGGDVNHLVPCRPHAPGDAQCAAQFIRAFGSKAFRRDRKSTRLNSSHLVISYAVFCLKKKKITAQFNATPPDRHTD